MGIKIAPWKQLPRLFDQFRGELEPGSRVASLSSVQDFTLGIFALILLRSRASLRKIKVALRVRECYRDL